MVWVNPPADGAAAAAAADGRSVGATGGVAAGGGSGGSWSFSGSQQQQQQQRQSGSGVPPPGISPHGLAGSAGASAAGAAAAAISSSEDAAKKIRKPYTISKSRESWTEQEHDKFLEALHLFDRDWKKIESFVGSKTVIQIRSHAQKYFLKVQKNGTSEHVPPPRPKRKAAHPYPQKASKNAPVPSHLTTAFQSSSCSLEQGYTLTKDTFSLLQTTAAGATMSPTAYHSQPHSMVDLERGAIMIGNCCSSSADGPWESLSLRKMNDQGNEVPSLRVMPDFVQVYKFLGNVFDPNTSGHLQKLREMDPIDVETVLLLMRNLSFNLTNPYFEGHKRLLSVYDVDMLQMSPGSAEKLLPA